MNRLPYAKPLKTEKKAPKPPNRVNRKRKKKLFQEDFGGKEYLAYIKAMPCALCSAEGYTVAAHVKSRGAGGKACDIVPLCDFRGGISIGCHRSFDTHVPWARKHEGRLAQLAEKLWSRFKRAAA